MVKWLKELIWGDDYQDRFLDLVDFLPQHGIATTLDDVELECENCKTPFIVTEIDY